MDVGRESVTSTRDGEPVGSMIMVTGDQQKASWKVITITMRPGGKLVVEENQKGVGLE